MWNKEVTLIQTKFGTDSIGQTIVEEISEKKVLCKTKSVGLREYYAAAEVGLKPEIIIVLKNYEYEAQKELAFNGRRFKVLRAYSNTFEEIELTCEAIPNVR